MALFGRHAAGTAAGADSSTVPCPLEPPSSCDAELKAVWLEVAPRFRREIGLIGLEAVCVQLLRMRDAGERVKAEGLIVADDRGAAVPHPAIAVERAAQAELLRWIKLYGL